jgi:hypothetical protein
MVSQVRAYPGEVDPDVDSDAAEVLSRPDAGPHEDRGTAVGSRRQDDPARPDLRPVDEPHPRCPTCLDHQASDRRVRPDREVGWSRVGRQIRVDGRDAHAAARAHRHPPDADGIRRVVVVHAREAHRIERSQGRRMDGGRFELRVTGNRDRPAIAVPRVASELRVGLQTPEYGQDVGKAPAGVAPRSPGVEIGGGAPDGEPGQP